MDHGIRISQNFPQSSFPYLTRVLVVGNNCEIVDNMKIHVCAWVYACVRGAVAAAATRRILCKYPEGGV